jgi:hypothetical protein
MSAPKRPSGVFSGGTMLSIPASAGDIIIDEAKPVATRAAIKAHFSFSAVIRILPTHIENISAKVLSISTEPNLKLSGSFSLKPYHLL